MQAAIWKEKQHIEILDWSTKELLPNEVLVKVKCCGICGTDQHIYMGIPAQLL
jgi:L-iditol 2-dehydrogenase